MTSIVNDDRLEVIVIETEKLETPTGAKGEPGEPGAPGEKGDTGEPGVKGDKGDKGDVGEQGETGTQAPAYVRATAVKVTGMILNGAREITTVSLAVGYELYSVQLSAAARIRLYDTTAHQTADLGRVRGVDPDAKLDHGVMLDFALDLPGSRVLSPVVSGITFTGFADVPITVDNIGSTPSTISITFVYLRRE